MTLNREQTRPDRYTHPQALIDVLLAELEQAERERDEKEALAANYRGMWAGQRNRANAAEARLVKADTLAEALKGLMAALAVDEDGDLIGPLEQWAGAWVAALEALAAYEQEQKP